MNLVNFSTTCPAPKPLIDPSFCPSFIGNAISLSPAASSVFQSPPTISLCGSSQPPATLIEKVYHALTHFFGRSEKQCNSLKERIDALAWKDQLQANPPIPNQLHPINWEKAQSWISAHKLLTQPSPSEGKERSKLLEMAKAFIAVTRHVSHGEFEHALQHSVMQFNRYIKEMNSKNYLVITGAKHKSNRWVSELALKYLDVLPIQVLQVNRDRVTDYLIEHPQVTHLVLFDDAAYSCDQTRNTLILFGKIDELLQRRTRGTYYGKPILEFSVITPFMRDPECVLMKAKPKTISMDLDPAINVFTSQKLYRLNELLSTDHLQIFEKYYNQGFPLEPPHFRARIPVYFDHKIADSQSSFPRIYRDGEVGDLGGDIGVKIPFIDDIDPPYRPPDF